MGRYAVRHRTADIATADTMEAALAVVRERIAGAAPYQAAMLELEVVKSDARGRVRRTVSGRQLVALATGVPEAELFGYGDWRAIDEAAGVGRNLEVEMVPDDGPGGRGRWHVVVRYERPGGDGTWIRDRAYLWSAPDRHEAESKLREAELHLGEVLRSGAVAASEEQGEAARAAMADG